MSIRTPYKQSSRFVRTRPGKISGVVFAARAAFAAPSLNFSISTNSQYLGGVF